MALKVIELLVDDALTGDTRVEEIALVLQPAIETEFMWFGRQSFETYNDYPKAAKENACKVLRWRDEHGDAVQGMTQVGWTRANQLCSGENISRETIARMSAFIRHKQNSQIAPEFQGEPWKDAGYVAWLGWGGTEGVEWAQRKLQQIDEAMTIDTSNLKPWSKTSGDTEMCGCGERTYQILEEGPCWENYIMIGWKRNAEGQKVPNCVPKEELSAYELDIFGYKTKYFYICPGAQATFKDIMSVKPTEDSIGMIRSAAVVADKVFEIEADVLEYKTASEQQLSEAKVLVEDFKDIIGEIEKIQGKTFDVSYMDNHIRTIESYVGQENMAYPIGQIQKGTVIDQASDCGCNCPDADGCWDNGGTYFGTTMINGVPVFDNPDEAATYAETIGCNGSHVHMVDGVEMYMPCTIHDQAINEDDEMAEYTEEEYEVAKLLQFLSKTDKQKFEAVMESMRGATLQEIKDRNHKNPTTYFKYERVLTGSPDREFCDSIEGRYFRRLEIDLLRDTNRDFGHNREPYSKWLYKGGPNCVHAWRKFLVQGKDIVDEGFAQGKAGMPPKSMPNNGYYSEETKKASEKAYAISQSQKMTRASSQVIIVDMDDTLVRGNSPIQKTIDYINDKAKTYRIVVVSGRQKSRTEETKRHLDQLGVLWDDIYLSDFPVGPNASNAFKEYKAKWLKDKGYMIVEAIDNDSEARRLYQKQGIRSVSPTSLSASFNKSAQFSINEEQRMLYSPAMKPGILIPRIDEMTREKYFVTFKPETIKVMSQRFLIEKRTDKTNYEHSNQKFNGVYLVESWIVDGEQDKAYSMGYSKQDVPIGTWMVGYRIDNDEVWDMIKQGKVKGLSIEGNFEYKFSVENTDEYLLKEIINILNQIN